jgi:hypothetical protein
VTVRKGFDVMIETARHWRVLAGCVAAGMTGMLGFAGTAWAQPAYPQPPLPAPSPTAQAATVTPNAAVAAPQMIAQPGVSTATPAGVAAVAPGGIATPPVGSVPVATIAPAASGTLFDFFKEKGVTLEPQISHGFKALTIVLPMPRGWAQVPDPNVPDAFAVIADRVGGNGLYSSNAQVVIYKLIGEFDPKEAISHGFVDSQQLPAWRSTDASLADYGGMPSSIIEGTYRENSLTLNTHRRHVIATAGPDKYLVSLSVTTSVDQVVPAADATDAIIRGFEVSVPTAAAPAAPAPPAAPALPAAPARAAAPSLAAPPQISPVQGLSG